MAIESVQLVSELSTMLIHVANELKDTSEDLDRIIRIISE